MTKLSTFIVKCRLETAPSNPGLFLKPTNLGVPLQDISCHPAHIHKSWPVSMVRRLGNLSTSHSYAEKAKEILVERFVRHLASPDLISRLRETSTSHTKNIEIHRTTMWRQDVGHIPVPSGLGQTHCKSNHKILER